MAQRVLATEEGRQLVAQMKSLLGEGIQGQVSQLERLGDQLCDPGVWDGPSAIKFRGVWPDARRDLENMLQALQDLNMKVGGITEDIMAAG